VRPSILAAALACAAGLVSAAAVAQGKDTIDYLIQRVERSGCSFVRNGTAHPSAEAASHLRRKLAAVRRELSPEEFIDHVASKSSSSGEPYLIRCDGKAEEQSSAWLRRALKERTG
jgi:hypothetical protein